ncbi:hypothetical protein HBI44_148450 [Parastagonospora nodorum]|nr:hypothetical protein HBI44_148450 [Parastagonospora nodorum]
MAYNPVMQGEQMQYQGLRVYPQNYEMRSLVPSYTSTKGSFFSHSTPVHTDATGIHQRDHSGKWTPGFWKQFPVLAILSILGILASTIASVVVLMQSHHKSLDDWGYGIAPSVYLAIASVVANALTAYALAIGLEITFWRNALRGHTLAGLNRNWLNGHSIYHALLHGLRPGGRITALACVFSVLALLRGPINQRASAVQSNVGYNTSGTLQLPVAQRIPDGYTAITFDTRSSTAMVGRLMPDFAQIMQDYSARANISMAHSDCGESCVASIKGFGFKTACDTTDFTLEKSTTGGAFDQTIFEASTSLYPIGERVTGQTGYDNAGIRFNVTYRVSRSYRDGSSVMVMKFKSHICNLTGSTAEYKVRLSSQTIFLAICICSASFEKLSVVCATLAARVIPGVVIVEVSYVSNVYATSAARFISGVVIMMVSRCVQNGSTLQPGKSHRKVLESSDSKNREPKTGGGKRKTDAWELRDS